MAHKWVMAAGSVALATALASCNETAEEAAPDDSIFTVPEQQPGDILCTLTGTFESQDQCDRFDLQYDNLTAGVDAFHPNETMIADKVNIVRYSIVRLPDSVQAGDGELADAVPEATPPPPPSPPPAPVPTPSPSQAATPPATGSPATPTPEPTSSSTPDPAPIPTATPSVQPTLAPRPSPSFTFNPGPIATRTPRPIATAVPTAAPRPTSTAAPIVVEEADPIVSPEAPEPPQEMPAAPMGMPRPIIIGQLPNEPTTDRSDAAIVIPEAFEEEVEPASTVDAPPIGAEPEPPNPVANGPTQEEIDRALDDASGRAARSITDDSVSSAVEIGQVKISPIMFACLQADPSFEIRPKECQAKNTIEEPDPVWIWEVIPYEQGEDFEMKLRSGIVVQADDQSLRRIGQPSRIAQIDVEVTALGAVERFFKELTKWINSPLEALGALAALIAAIAGVRTAWRKLRGKKDTTAAEPKPEDADEESEDPADEEPR